MTTQTSYNENPEVGRAGDLVSGESSNCISRTVEDAAGIPFGAPVARGAADRGCIIFDSVADDFIGIARRNKSASPEDGDKHAQYREAGICEQGVIWGTAGAALTAGGNVYWHVANANYVDADGAGIEQVPGCEYDTSASDGEPVAIRVRKFTPAV